VSEAGQNGKLGSWPSRTIQAGIPLAAAEQTPELHDVRCADRIGIGEDDHRGCLDRSNVVGPVVVFPEQFAELGE
jgi:hypothetical protein